jgi:hypothetical protein
LPAPCRANGQLTACFPQSCFQTSPNFLPTLILLFRMATNRLAILFNLSRFLIMLAARVGERCLSFFYRHLLPSTKFFGSCFFPLATLFALALLLLEGGGGFALCFRRPYALSRAWRSSEATWVLGNAHRVTLRSAAQSAHGRVCSSPPAAAAQLRAWPSWQR